ncbi:MAG: cupin domain-containing protein [Alphaproteobacteria bacterium]|nr:cupin domain-containing protein [Alphaproteobacteria bacterium]
MSHEIADEFLLDYASGAAPAPVGLLVASHLALNAEARRNYRRLEAVGGALLEAIEPVAPAPDSLARILARIDAGDGIETRTRPAVARRAGGLPAPIAALVPNGLDALAWRRLARGVEEAALDVEGDPQRKTKLLRIAAGRAIPKHTHRGLEMTLVLEGGFADEAGHYDRGDVCVTDESIEHQPTADRARDCLCLAVFDAPIRLTGPFLRLLNPFLPR